INGTASDANGLAALTGALDGGSSSSLLSLLQANGSFTLTAAQLAALSRERMRLNSSPVALVATDNAGNNSSVDLSFVLDTTAPAVSAAPAHAAGATPSLHDALPISINGTASDANGLAALTGALDGGSSSSLLSLLQANGSFTLTAAQLAA